MTTVAQFQIEHHQFLDPDGKTTQELPSFAKNTDELISLYRLMTLTRVFDTKAIALQRTGKLGTYASCLGHEAAHVGIGSAMKPEDCFAPMYREYGAQFYRGVRMQDVLLYWGGDERGNNFEQSRHDFAWCVPIATQCLHASGAAMAFKLRKENRAAVAVVGDGGTSEGDFYEAVNAAGAWQLPMVFVVVNNQWAISVPRQQQTGAPTLAQKGLASGLHCLQVDGNDLIAVRWAVEEALKKARAGEGPTLIEAITYRLSDHTTADDASRYRDNQELEDAKQKEPLIRLRNYLKSQRAWDDDQESDLLAQCAQEVETAVNDYLNTPPQEIAAMFDYLYANPPESLIAQRDEAIKEANNHG